MPRTSTRASEKSLDRALELALKGNPKFCSWFLEQTKFRGLGACYEWSRSNYVWGKIPVIIEGVGSRTLTTSKVESETDVLLVLRLPDTRIIALHIENKLASGSFEPNQPEMYAIRAQHWVGDRRYQAYTDWDTVLLAPDAFISRNARGSSHFGCRITHEAVSHWVPEFQAPNGDA